MTATQSSFRAVRRRLSVPLAISSLVILAFGNAGCDSTVASENEASSTESFDQAALGKVGLRASGAGEIAVTSNRRTFAFTAVESTEGGVMGQLSLDYKEIDVAGHGVIDCLVVDGNVATMSGSVTSGSYFGNDLRGRDLAFWFRAEDNGEPGKDNDRMTGLFVEEIDLLSVPDCTGELPFTPTLHTLMNGNIQVAG